MLGKLMAKLRRRPGKGNNQGTGAQTTKLSGKLKRDTQLIKNKYQDCDDVKYRDIVVPAMGMRRCLIVYVEGLVNSDALNRDIIGKLQEHSGRQEVKDIKTLLATGEVDVFGDLDKFDNDILQGKVAILIDGIAEAFVIDTKNWPMRAIEEPLQERLVRGPREGFTEVIQINLALIRRRLPHPQLKVKINEVGARSRTKVALLYLEDVCNLDVVNELQERIDAIDIDGIMDPGALTELISERTISPFPMFLSTERPDKVMGGLLQGKVAIITDGSPFVLMVPVIAPDFFQNPEDYYMAPVFGTLARGLRLAGIAIGTTLTAAYVAVVSYHYEMIPRDIIIFIARTREGVPFTPITEALLLEASVELLREASIRLPSPIGPTVTIAGALIVGQAAVDARLVSPVLLIFVALSFLAGSSVPNYEASLVIRLLRFPLIIMAGFL